MSEWVFLGSLTAIHTLLIAVGGVLAYRAVHLDTRFTDRAWLHACLVASMLNLVLTVPLLYIVALDSTATGWLVAASLLICAHCIGFLFCIFAPRIAADRQIARKHGRW